MTKLVIILILGVVMLWIPSVDAKHNNVNAAVGEHEFGLYLRQEPIREIYSFTVVEPVTEEEWFAKFAEETDLWKRIRDEQSQYYWFIGAIIPRANDDPFYWAENDRLVITTTKGRTASTEAILATQGNFTLNGPIFELHQGFAGFYSDILVDYLEGGKNHTIYVGFPKQVLGKDPKIETLTLKMAELAAK
ncbi:MAG: hypothetical protein V1838_02905 [Patescibacteria group bacterium]